MSQPITIAHISDLHLAPLEGFSPAHWNLKRLLGYINWRQKRRHVHLREVVDRLAADLEAQAADHIAVTGDLVNIGLPRELDNARAWLETLGPPGRVSVVPGNHDIYARIGGDRGVARWDTYMASDAWGRSVRETPATRFPFVRRLGSTAIIGLNSALPTPPAVAWGKLGRDQLAALAGLLNRLRRDKLFRLVLIHHPPLPGQASHTRGLRDASALERVLTTHGAELVLHGHNHQNLLAWRSAHGRSFPLVGVGSGSIGRRHGDEPLGRYHLYRIADEANGRRIELIARGLAEAGGPVIELERRWLEAPAGSVAGSVA